MKLISHFDPWHSSLCTCPPKLTFNPYTGCDHLCVYCYASRYIPNFSACRPKKDLLVRLEREATQLRGETVSIANSSDPYPGSESTLGITRKCLKILMKSDCKLQIVTKSNIITRDADLLTEIPSTVTLTITTNDDHIAKLLEPQAPAPTERLKTAENLTRKGIPVSVRIDPVIPLVNDNPGKLVEMLSDIGVKHITSSTYKARIDNWHRFESVFPQVAHKLKVQYFDKGERIGGNLLLPKGLRLELMKNIRNLADGYGLKFGVCREDLTELNTAPCDGSWLLSQV
jgi:DNA repair photolyase